MSGMDVTKERAEGGNGGGPMGGVSSSGSGEQCLTKAVLPGRGN